MPERPMTRAERRKLKREAVQRDEVPPKADVAIARARRA